LKKNKSEKKGSHQDNDDNTRRPQKQSETIRQALDSDDDNENENSNDENENIQSKKHRAAEEKRNKERAAGSSKSPPKSVPEKKKVPEKVPEKTERPVAVEKAPAGVADKKRVVEPKKKVPEKAPEKTVERTAPAKKTGEKPSALTSVIHPALSKLSKSTKDEHVQKALEELKESFDAAEAVQPGIVHNFIAQIIETLKSAS